MLIEEEEGLAAYRRRIADAQHLLGIETRAHERRGLPLCLEARELQLAQRDADGREHRLVPAAGAAWQRMRAAAADAGIRLHLVSAFRSFDYQIELIRRELAQGLAIAEICQSSACPGYSEHHTGRAIDIDTPDLPGLSERFEDTAAFAWLQAHAGAFGFTLSYPRGNAAGYVYEPWHWLYGRDGAVLHEPHF
ncbi:D-alanyl-D-alanine carboxypeptidase family protein [Pelomonas sp. PFR6]|uniref:D-alanyl-D-alanine carboxypeptidase family protein n=2 Tax=Roseateles violae TaxID=3058042 RepID=A0ABT8DUY5_9BURK|nr:D-alanyl-D-alanine carboxypeptidase family protein [Pelomonas sp. PFR6]